MISSVSSSGRGSGRLGILILGISMRCVSSPTVTYELTSSYVHNLREWESRKEIAEKGASYMVIDDHGGEQVHMDTAEVGR